MPRMRLEGQRLELGLRPVSDDRHGVRPARSEIFAATADMAAVRKAVRIVISLRSIGYPLPTSARTPKAVTVCGPRGCSWVAVDVFEAVEPAVARRHQLDDAVRAVGGDAGVLSKAASGGNPPRYRPTAP